MLDYCYLEQSQNSEHDEEGSWGMGNVKKKSEEQ